MKTKVRSTLLPSKTRFSIFPHLCFPLSPALPPDRVERTRGVTAPLPSFFLSPTGPVQGQRRSGARIPRHRSRKSSDNANAFRVPGE